MTELKFPADYINKVICGKCIEVMKHIPDSSIDMVLTDPPYNISSDLKITMSNHPDSNNRKQDRTITYDFGEWDHFDSEQEFLDFTKIWMCECYRILKPHGNFIMFFNSWLMSDVKRMWESIGGRSIQKLYWLKSNPKPRLRKVDFMQGVEELFWGCKSDSGHIFNYEIGQQINYVKTAVFYNTEASGHPTQKPELSIEYIIKYLSNKDSIILDPFAGSGTTAAVSLSLGRKFIAIEKDQKWAAHAWNRVAYVSNPIHQTLTNTFEA